VNYNVQIGILFHREKKAVQLPIPLETITLDTVHAPKFTDAFLSSVPRPLESSGCFLPATYCFSCRAAWSTERRTFNAKTQGREGAKIGKLLPGVRRVAAVWISPDRLCVLALNSDVLSSACPKLFRG